MANKCTVALTKEQYKEIITTMRTGGAGFRPNPRIAAALILEANLGIRISDILSLTPKCIIYDGGRWRLDINEIKTSKYRPFTVADQIHDFIVDYCKEYDIGKNDKLFPFKERNVQQYLAKVADYLGYENIGTHSFRKFFGTDIYRENGNDIVLVQELYQHSSPETTRKYITIMSEEKEEALRKHVYLL